jgi:two-component system LytT family response regulator
MITAIIIDDEWNNVTMLSGLLRNYCPDVTLLGTAESAKQGKILIETLQPELILLDVEMPYYNGFDLLRSLPKIDAEVVFITAFDQYAIDAFQYAALDYLLKPINIEQLQRTLARAILRVKEKLLARNYELLLNNLEKKETEQKAIIVSEKGEQYFIAFADIKYIIADGSYTCIHTDKRTFVSTKNLVDYEDILPNSIFCRIHNGHIVNKKHIVKVQKGRGGAALMRDGRELEIAVRRKDAFLKMMQG